MKTLFAIATFILSTASLSSFAQERIELKTLAQDVKILVKDSFAIINVDGNLDTFKVHKKANERTYTFQNPADKAQLENILKIDKGEIKNKFENAFPNVDAIEQLIIKAATSNNGIILASKEAGGVMPGSNDEIGGKKANNHNGTTGNNWMTILIAAIAGIIVGWIIASLTRKKPEPLIVADSSPSEDVINFEETIAPVKDDAKKVTDAAKAKINKLQADKKQLVADTKGLKTDLATAQSQLQQQQQFHKTIYGNLMKDVISPMNDALEKGNQNEATSQLLRLAAQSTSIARHELGIKQAYDSVNIALLLKQQLPANLNIETITTNTPPDRIPNNIHNVLAFMKNNNAGSLDQVVIFGYKIGN